MRDIQNRTDLKVIVELFYEKLLSDKKINHFFEKFRDPKTLAEHLDILVDFWDNIVFYSGTYQRNAMASHLMLHRGHPMKPEHFDTWLNHLSAAIDKNFQGDNCHILKTRALSIATVMRIKINELDQNS
ncbi:group III truncated hemoglobin [Namhaeicola litoreus]|uniref:Group III truncated hemoglobin n=1 Tax=Namhaeicola litoreus TaxID=1052145 RepID=A0ABW3Y4W9_9FLAO